MVTLLLYFVLLLVVSALLFVVASFVFGRGEQMAAMPPDVSPVSLPSGRPVGGSDVRRLRLSVVLRGYRMSEVDWVLDALAGELDARDREIGRLREDRDRAMQAAILAARDGGGPEPDAVEAGSETTADTADTPEAVGTRYDTAVDARPDTDTRPGSGSEVGSGSGSGPAADDIPTRCGTGKPAHASSAAEERRP